ncbi:MAG TPA: preprotein translocase subunit SecG, partial [Bacilli bacterium]|nr:preprotein translocase subunit SecG [Bacilli bacterium]
ELFQNVKERGSELFISRLTLVLGIVFFVISFILYLQ